MDEQTTTAQDNTNAVNRIMFNLQLFAEDTPPASDVPPIDSLADAGTDSLPPQNEPPADNNPPADNELPNDTPPADDAPPADLFTDYKPELPNGVNEEMLAEALPVFKELGLNPEQANKIIPLADKLVQDTVSKVVEDINQQCENNYKEVMDGMKNNRKNGGAVEFEKNVGQINALFKKYGDDSTPEQLHTALTALAGFDKEAVKPFFNVLVKLAADAADDTTLLGSAKTQESTMYPGLPKGARFK
jgi:antitoxin component of RelBE/YafQ-DinJ toxin-antitoxin module